MKNKRFTFLSFFFFLSLFLFIIFNFYMRTIIFCIFHWMHVCMYVLCICGLFFLCLTVYHHNHWINFDNKRTFKVCTSLCVCGYISFWDSVRRLKQFVFISCTPSLFCFFFFRSPIGLIALNKFSYLFSVIVIFFPMNKSCWYGTIEMRLHWYKTNKRWTKRREMSWISEIKPATQFLKNTFIAASSTDINSNVEIISWVLNGFRRCINEQWPQYVYVLRNYTPNSSLGSGGIDALREWKAGKCSHQ